MSGRLTRTLSSQMCPRGVLSARSRGRFHLGSRRVPQQEILDHKFAFAPRKWATTGAARCLTVDGFRTGFDFDELIKRIAVRTVESRPAGRHKRPHTDFFGCWRYVIIPGRPLAITKRERETNEVRCKSASCWYSCQGCLADGVRPPRRTGDSHRKSICWFFRECDSCTTQQ